MRDHHPLENTTIDAIKAHPLELRERGFKLYCDRRTLPEIGEALAVPSATVAGWSMRGKWKARRAMMEAPPPPKDAGATSDSPPDESAGLTFAEKQAKFREKSANLALKAIHEASQLEGMALINAADKVSKLHQMGQRALDLEKASPAIVVNVGLLGRAASGDAPRLEKRVAGFLVESSSSVAASEPVTYEEDTGCIPVETATEVEPQT